MAEESCVVETENRYRLHVRYLQGQPRSGGELPLHRRPRLLLYGSAVVSIATRVTALSAFITPSEGREGGAFVVKCARCRSIDSGRMSRDENPATLSGSLKH
uniref:Uncharacterized protein n=1 Tax=Sphaerodactylus townsendi TaxID=933632 RepID=A0ACB8GBJ5_9SAUR